MSAVTRTLDLLELVAEAHEELSLTAIAERAELPLPTAYRLLKTLTDEDFLHRDPVSLEYSAGRRLQRMSSLTRRGSIGAVAERHLRELSERFDETAMVTQLIDGRAICVALAESRRPLHLSTYVGRTVSLHAAASARVLYSGHSDAAVRQLLADHDFERLRPGTPADVEAVIEHLENVRRHGFDVCDNEFDVDVWAASAPVYDSSDRVVAGITLTTPQERSTPQSLRDEIIEAVIRTADDVAHAIGGSSGEVVRSHAAAVR